MLNRYSRMVKIAVKEAIVMVILTMPIPTAKKVMIITRVSVKTVITPMMAAIMEVD